MQPQQRSLLAIVLSVGVLILWYMFFAPEPPQPKPGETTPSLTSGEAKPSPLEAADRPIAKVAETAEPEAVAKGGPERQVHLQTPLFDATFSNRGGQLLSLVLPGYRAGVEKDAPVIDLVSAAEDQALALRCRHCNFHLPSHPVYSIVSEDERSVTFRWDGKQYSLIRRYQVDEDRYLIDHELTLINHSDRVFEGQLGISWVAKNKAEKGGFLQMLKGPTDTKGVIFQRAGSVEREKKKGDDREGIERGVISWAGLENRYFLSAFISRQLSEQEVLHYQFRGLQVASALYYPKLVIPAGEKSTLNYSVYLGPKEVEALKAVGVGLDAAIDYGWFSLLAMPILYCLKFFESFLLSWGLAIILLTLLVKILLNPLTVKGLKSMKAMQKLQPKLKELRDKYKDDKQRLNQETMQMFKTHKVNPMGGCLPMIIQMPIYIALYKVLYNSIELFHAPFLFYKDLAAPDPYMVTPILLGIFMVLQQKMTPTASADPMQKKMMMFMPIMFTGFMLFLPMGLVLYILVNTVMTVVQHYMFNHDIRWRDIVRGRIKLR